MVSSPLSSSISDPYTTDELESLLLAQAERFEKHKLIKNSVIQANQVSTQWLSTRPNKKPNFQTKPYRGGHNQSRPSYPNFVHSFMD